VLHKYTGCSELLGCANGYLDFFDAKVGPKKVIWDVENISRKVPENVLRHSHMVKRVVFNGTKKGRSSMKKVWKSMGPISISKISVFFVPKKVVFHFKGGVFLDSR